VHGPKNSLARVWYRLNTRRRLARNEWDAPYWQERNGQRVVACRQCPKFDAVRSECGVPFGTPLRKCVVAATEAHLRDTRECRVLELGYARHSYGKTIVELCGGSWTGIEPLVDRRRPAVLGSGSYGHAGEIPFPDETFDLVFGNQTFEHWAEPLPDGTIPPSYRDCLAEIWRVLKPGGRLYLDAPIHLHGHEMFVAGDIERILALFDDALWSGTAAERWRYDHAPLPRYPTPEGDARDALRNVPSYDAAAIADVQVNGTVWLLVVTSTKPARGRERSAAAERKA
jgi:SAM-dependent methyltransferase